MCVVVCVCDSLWWRIQWRHCVFSVCSLESISLFMTHFVWRENVIGVCVCRRVPVVTHKHIQTHTNKARHSMGSMEYRSSCCKQTYTQIHIHTITCIQLNEINNHVNCHITQNLMTTPSHNIVCLLSAALMRSNSPDPTCDIIHFQTQKLSIHYNDTYRDLYRQIE